MEDKEKKNNPKMIEKFSLIFRRKYITNRLATFLIACILLVLFIIINLYVAKLDLPKIDITENKIYTLSEASKRVIKNIDKDITIYIYGFDEKSYLADFIKQYSKVNEHIEYEFLTSETNLELIKEYDLNDGYQLLIIVTEESRKIIDVNNFYTYDYTTYQQIDVTEQTITNAILDMLVENKPKVYFTTGHGEFSSQEVMSLQAVLMNESFEIGDLNILINGGIPEDCNVLVVLSPMADFFDSEIEAIKKYMDNGGNIFLTLDIAQQEVNYINLQQILDMYGVKVDRGYIIEQDSNYTIQSTPTIFMPQTSWNSPITKDITTDSYMFVLFAQRLSFLEDEELILLGLEKEDLLYSTESSAFITDLSSSASINSAEIGSFIISSMITKTIKNTDEDINKESKLVISTTGSFLIDSIVNEISSNVVLSSIGSNRDFAINSISVLADKENILTIRKDMSTSTYLPTENQNRIVLAIIFVVPILIIVKGIIIWNYRRKRK